MGASSGRYRFRSVWQVAGDAGDAFDVLRAVDEYPSWWPEVRGVRRTGSEGFAVSVRSVLPYDLRFGLEQEEANRETGVLRARLTGDLAGVTSWTIRGGLLEFDEDVVLGKAWLNRLEPIARPAFEWNHAVMMRHGERGLRERLARHWSAPD